MGSEPQTDGAAVLLHRTPLTPVLPLSSGCGAVTADECLQCCSPPSLPSYSLSSSPTRSLIPRATLHFQFQFFPLYFPPLISFHLFSFSHCFSTLHFKHAHFSLFFPLALHRMQDGYSHSSANTRLPTCGVWRG